MLYFLEITTTKKTMIKQFFKLYELKYHEMHSYGMVKIVIACITCNKRLEKESVSNAILRKPYWNKYCKEKDKVTTTDSSGQRALTDCFTSMGQ